MIRTAKIEPGETSRYHFWARGYCVSTVGLDEQVIREYIRVQEAEERMEEKLEVADASGR